MGGQGSGRHVRLTRKTTVGECRQLHVLRLYREGLLQPGYETQWGWYNNNGEVISSILLKTLAEGLELSYSFQSKPAKNMHYLVTIEWTSCNYGGKRPWFSCPKCHKRVAKLYLKNGYFYCRKCHNLTYKRCQESGNRMDEVFNKVYQLRKKLGDNNNSSLFHSPIPDRPKGMHWKTYNKLRYLLLNAEEELIEIERSLLNMND